MDSMQIERIKFTATKGMFDRRVQAIENERDREFFKAMCSSFEGEIKRLSEIIDKHLHLRKCHDCENVDYHKDNILPSALCEKCGSADTRRVLK